MGLKEDMVKDFLFTKYFWAVNITAVTRTMIAAMAAAKLASPPVSLTNSL